MNLLKISQRKVILYDKSIIQRKNLIGRLYQCFLIYFKTFSVPTADTLFLLILSILTLESAHSIRFLYQHFLSGITVKSLNVFYYACSYAKSVIYMSRSFRFEASAYLFDTSGDNGLYWLV